MSDLEEIAERLVNANKESDLPNYVCIAVAGGGGHAIAMLASTPGASSLFLEGIIAYDRCSFQNYVGEAVGEDFKYSSREAAAMLSRAAVRRALQYRCTTNLAEYHQCIGIGVSSALTTTKLRLGRGSFGFIVATKADGSQWHCHVQLQPQLRTRTQEDQFMGGLILRAIEQLRSEAADKIILDNEKDQIEESYSRVDCEDPIAKGAERILSGDVEAILFLPQNGDNNKFVAMIDPVLPMECLVFPGSFDPPHEGHTTLAQVASSGWHGSSAAVFFELSLTNPDKPSMNPQSVSRRVHQILGMRDRLPKEWGILVTGAPLFAQKVEILKPYMSQVNKDRPQMGFVIGTDTMVRILNPKYYNNSEDDMFEAVRAMGHAGVHFVVGGRLDQQDRESGKFVSGEDEVSALPKDVQSMFTIVQEQDFRVDISSSEIRKQLHTIGTTESAL